MAKIKGFSSRNRFDITRKMVNNKLIKLWGHEEDDPRIKIYKCRICNMTIRKISVIRHFAISHHDMYYNVLNELKNEDNDLINR